MRRLARWLIVLGVVTAACGFWASSQTRDDDLRARLEALEKRVHELERRLANLERQQQRWQVPVVPRVPYGVPYPLPLPTPLWERRGLEPRGRQVPGFGQPLPAPDVFVQPYYYPLTPE